MSLCFVFSGTSEGRELIEQLADSGISCLVFVATEYGNSVMKAHTNITVKVGRLEKDEIEVLIEKKNPDFVIDATHPHAEIITNNIKNACENIGCINKYIRVSRSINDSSLLEQGNEELKNLILPVNSVDEAVSILTDKKTSDLYNGKVMLTTGVKELKGFITEELKDRLVVRVIPSVESLEEVYRCGVDTKSVIAMEGPFSTEMNIALIKQYKISVLVTKNSGKRGGFSEKLLACKRCGIKAIVIEKSEEKDQGKTVSEAVTFIKSKLNIKDIKKVYLVGTGLCNKEYLTIKALNAIKDSTVIVGAKRMAEFGKSINESAQVYCEYDAKKVLDIIDNSKEKKIAVLYSGDTGLCSGAKGLERIICDRRDLDVEVIPGISSVSYFASRIGIQYSDYPFISLHDYKKEYMDLFNKYGGFISICSGMKDVIDVTEKIRSVEANSNIIFGYNLCSEDEIIRKINSDEDIKDLSEGLYVIAVIK